MIYIINGQYWTWWDIADKFLSWIESWNNLLILGDTSFLIYFSFLIVNFQQSPVKINQISLDESGEHMGVCSEDGKVHQEQFPPLFIWKGPLQCYFSRPLEDLCTVKFYNNITLAHLPYYQTHFRKLIIKVKYIWFKSTFGKVITKNVNTVTGIKLINSYGRGTCHCNYCCGASYSSLTSLMFLQECVLMLLWYKSRKLDSCVQNFYGLVVFHPYIF